MRLLMWPSFLILMAAMLPLPAQAQQAASPASGGSATGAATVNAAEPVATGTGPIDMEDPLAEFRRAQAVSGGETLAPGVPTADGTQPAASATTGGTLPASNATPPPTPGGFQQPATGAVGAPNDQYYNLGTLTEEDIETRQKELEQKAREQAFDAALNGQMPLSPDQIRAMLDRYKVVREASEERIGGTPRPEITVETVSLDPGVTPPVIKLSPGHVTSVTVMDITGQPWPVMDVSWGGNFEVISPAEGGHVIRISPLAAHEVGNMSVQLIGLKTPVTFTLETQLDVVQYRFDARIPEYGPNATPPIIDPGITTVAGSDKSLTQILDGTPPAGSVKLDVEGVDPRTSVYRSGGTMYLRTPLTLLSPGWSASVKSADGMTVYVVNNSPVFLLSDHGKMVRAMVEENRTSSNEN